MAHKTGHTGIYYMPKIFSVKLTPPPPSHFAVFMFWRGDYHEVGTCVLERLSRRSKIDA